MAIKDLLKIQDSRAFLRKALELHFGAKKKLNLAAFSRRAGFSSRSYLSELLAGKKGYSPSALLKIKNNLKVQKPLAAMFEQLVLLENPNLRGLRQSESLIRRRLEKVRQQFLETLQTKQPSLENIRRFINSPKTLVVYAALGSVSRGASLVEIARRTKYKTQDIKNTLQLLLELELVAKKVDRYHPLRERFEFRDLGIDPDLPQLFRDVCSDVSQQAPELVTDKKAWLYYSTLSIDKHQRLEIKNRIQDAVLNILEEFQVEDGDHIEQIFISLH